MAKNTNLIPEPIIAEKIFDLNFEDIIGKCFGRYAKYIIQERALPDVRDGLKPVQRRIIYAMHDLKLTYDYEFKKSARIVGEVIGKYHPHGDTSVYEALVRMSQTWKFLHPLIWMHGNNGSIDGDNAAAMRYTEAKLQKIANYLIGDLHKNAIEFQDNFDESEREPVVFASHIPNLLLNGVTGIAAGYATDIPPHNLSELIAAITHRLQNSGCSYEEIVNIIKGPDFPTGCDILNLEGIDNAYRTGKGKIVIQSRYKITEIKSTEHLIEITEIPYNVLKINIIKEIHLLKIKNNLNIITEIRDDSGKNGLKIIIVVKDNVDNTNKLMQFLLFNSSLRINYNFNMVAIVKNKPKLLGIVEIIDEFIAFQEEITIKSATFDLDKATNRLEVVQGLIKTMSILDQVIKLIRNSKSRKDAIDRLKLEIGFSEIQAVAIVDLRLYRLTSTDVLVLENDAISLGKQIKMLKEIINNKNILHKYIINYLSDIEKEFGKPRLSVISDEKIGAKVGQKVVIEQKVKCIVTRDGYLKNILNVEIPQNNLANLVLKEQDIIIFSATALTTDYILLITDEGNYLIFQVNEIKVIKEKELGTPVFDLRKIKGPEKMIFATILKNYDPEKNNLPDLNFLFITKLGKTKQSNLLDFVETKQKAMQCFKLNDDDKLVSAIIAPFKYILLLTNLGNYTFFNVDQVSIFSTKTGGTSALRLGKNEHIREALTLDNDASLGIILTNGEIKTKNMSELKLTKRNRNPLLFPETTSRNKARYLIDLNNYRNCYWISSQDNKKPPIFLEKMNTVVLKNALKQLDKTTAKITFILDFVLQNENKEEN